MKELIRIGIRLFVIYAVFLFLKSIPSVAAYEIVRAELPTQVGANQPALPVAAYFVSWIVYVAFLVLLWTKAAAISSLVLIHGGEPVTIGVDLDYKKLLSVGLIMLSIYLSVTSLPDLARAVMMRITAKQSAVPILNQMDLVRENATILANGIRIALSLTLIAYHRRIAVFIQAKATNSVKTNNAKD